MSSGNLCLKRFWRTADVFNGVISAARVRFRVLIRYGCNDFDFLRRLNLFLFYLKAPLKSKFSGAVCLTFGFFGQVLAVKNLLQRGI